MYFITVTHLVTSVENGCCPRTLKYLYAVAAAKWIVSINCKLHAMIIIYFKTKTDNYYLLSHMYNG